MNWNFLFETFFEPYFLLLRTLWTKYSNNYIRTYETYGINLHVTNLSNGILCKILEPFL
jgi:hypothetical protein